MRFEILEGNMDRLEKKMIRIRNKCRKYRCDFKFEKLGETFKEVTDEDGNTFVGKFIIIDAEGVAKVNDWRFIASVDFTENGNIINKAVDVEVPERYYKCKPHCEHCNMDRKRRYAFIIQNEVNHEFKLVGKACLKDFTNGMDAEAVAGYTAMFNEIIEGEKPSAGCKIERFCNTVEYLRYVAEAIRVFGYVKSEKRGESTKDKATNYYGYYNGWFDGYWTKEVKETIGKEIRQYGINAEHEETIKLVENALAWVATQEEDNNYIHNLKTACSLDYINSKHFGILASLFPTYDKTLERQKKVEDAQKKDGLSEWYGNVGDRVELKVTDIKCLTGWETQFGYTYLYKITDDNNNIFVWKTQRYIEEMSKIKGTVKEHKEFRGIKQTELTRCRLV